MFKNLYIDLGMLFNDFNEKGSDGFCIIKCAVPCKLLNELYLTFVKDGIPTIQSLPKEQKTKYWNIAKRFYQTEPEAIKASVAAYVLELLTSQPTN